MNKRDKIIEIFESFREDFLNEYLSEQTKNDHLTSLFGIIADELLQESEWDNKTWIRKDEEAGNILNSFLKLQTDSSPLYEISMKLLRKLIIYTLEQKEPEN